MDYKEMKKELVYWQRLLRLAGYYTGEIDGIRGPLTNGAEFCWENASNSIAAGYGTFDKRSEGNILTLIPPAQRMAREWLAKAQEVAEAKGYSVKIICGTRTYAEQDALYKQRPKVTNARGGYSWHNFGLAFDFGVFSKDSKKYYGNSPLYNELGKLARNIEDAEWGGDWKSFKDTPHIQLRKFATTKEARNNFERS